MADVVLCTFNAKYSHTAFGLRYLKANLGELESRCEILEATIDDRPHDVAERILDLNPNIVGLSVYIWNATSTLELVRCLKRIRPELCLVLGGPEVSYESDQQEIVALADYVVLQEGELLFRQLCQEVLAGRRPSQKIQRGSLIELEQLQFPYRLYSDHDLRHRVVYVEASRGCPFRCEFCLSSLDKGVRYFPVEAFLSELRQLFERGARRFKFIDRTFNLRIEVSQAILEFFLELYQDDLFLHFEMVPDRFPEELRALVARFPAGAVQFEIGIQSFDEAVGQRISRRQNLQRLEDNLLFLRHSSGVHVHADLIVGLPGEDVESFGRGFDRLWNLRPQEIQVGILKRLRGTPIVRHDHDWEMVYSASPPYEVLQTGSIDFKQMQKMKRFARYWDLVANRGQFPQTLATLLADSPFRNFLHWSEWLFERTGATHNFALARLAELLAEFLEDQLGLPFETVARAIAVDYTADEKRHVPPFLLQRSDLPEELRERPKAPLGSVQRGATPERQARHLRRQQLAGSGPHG